MGSIGLTARSGFGHVEQRAKIALSRLRRDRRRTDHSLRARPAMTAAETWLAVLAPVGAAWPAPSRNGDIIAVKM